MVLMLILRSRPSHGQDYISVTVILRSRSFWNQMIMCFNFYSEAGGWLSSECLSYLSHMLLVKGAGIECWHLNRKRGWPPFPTTTVHPESDPSHEFPLTCNFVGLGIDLPRSESVVSPAELVSVPGAGVGTAGFRAVLVISVPT